MLNDTLTFIGMDPALKGDFFGICVHELTRNRPNDNTPWMPRLKKLIKLQADNYVAMWDALNGGVLARYRDFYMLNIDYSNEKTIADFLEEKYGERKITKTPFTKGESGSKMKIAQDTLQLLNSGYKFPDHHKIPNPEARENIRILKQQLVQEEIVINPDGSIKFRHKGKHNDLLHAWMLSLSSTREYMLAMQGSGGPTICGSLVNRGYSPSLSSSSLDIMDDTNTF